MKLGIWLAAILGLLLWSPASRAQAPPAQTAAPAKAPAAPQGKAASTAPGAKSRDPFRDPTPVSQKPNQIPTNLPAGNRGLVIEQLQLQGVVRGINGRWIAVVIRNNDRGKLSYFLHENDAVYNGVVTRITADGVVFRENTTDDLGKTISREVVKRVAAE